MSDMYFKSLPDKSTPLIPSNLDKLNDIKVSPTQPTTNEKVWIQYSKNIYNPKTDIEIVGGYRNINQNGSVSSLETYNGLKIKVKPNTTYITSSNLTDYNSWSNLCFFDASMNFISGDAYNSSNKVFTTPENCYYITIAIMNTYTWFQLEQGSIATEYEAYVDRKINVDGEEFLDVEKVNNNLNYSTEEQVIGTWIDGKPIYRLVFTTELVQCSYSHLNVDTIVDINVKSYFNDILFSVGRHNSAKDLYSWFVNIVQKIIALDIGSTWLPNYNYSRIILEYTKTTD